MLTHSSSLDEPEFNFPFNMFFFVVNEICIR